AGFASACAPSRGGALPDDTPCATRLPLERPALEPPPPLAAPRSQLAVELALDVAGLRRELERRVPVVLAEARDRPVGTPGEATYRVSRGALDVRLADGALLVS